MWKTPAVMHITFFAFSPIHIAGASAYLMNACVGFPSIVELLLQLVTHELQLIHIRLGATDLSLRP